MMPEGVEVLLTSFFRKSLVSELLKGQVYPFWDSTGKRYIYNLMTKERFSDKPNLSTLCKTLEAMTVHASTNDVSTIAMHNFGYGLDQLNWQEFAKLLRDVFAKVDVQIMVYTLEENGIHAMFAKGDAKLYADDEIERYSSQFSVEKRELETDFTEDTESCQTTRDQQFPFFATKNKDHNNPIIDHYLQYEPKEHTNYVEELDFRYSDITDDEMIFLIDMFILSTKLSSKSH